MHDVTSGGNGYCDGEGAASCGDPNILGAGILDCDFPATGSTPTVGDRACDALGGFDGPSGVGTPNGLGAFSGHRSGGQDQRGHVDRPWLGWDVSTTTSDPFPGGKIGTYSWNWGDGTAATVTTTPSAKHTYAKSGAKETITLTVTDDFGEKGSTTHVVAVS